MTYTQVQLISERTLMSTMEQLFTDAKYDQVIDLASNHAKLSLKERELLALSHFQTQNFEKALEIFEDALKIEPTRALNHYHLGLCYLELNNTQEAVIALKKSIQTDPLLQKAYYALGSIYVNYNLQQEAVQIWREIILINPFTDSARKAYDQIVQNQIKPQ